MSEYSDWLDRTCRAWEEALGDSPDEWHDDPAYDPREEPDDGEDPGIDLVDDRTVRHRGARFVRIPSGGRGGVRRWGRADRPVIGR